MTRDFRNFSLSVVLTACALAITSFGAEAQEAPSEEVISAGVGQRLLELIAFEAEERWEDAADGYSVLLERPRLSRYERATLLKLRGRARYELDDAARTISDWRSAIALGVLSTEDANILRINTGQLLMVGGEVREGIDLIEAAVALGTPLNADLAMRLAQAHGMIEAYEPGLAYAREAFNLAEVRERTHYALLLYFYQTLELDEEQVELMAEMVEVWPQEKPYWASYASLLARTERPQEAFAANTIMYVNGMLTESNELVRLAQYYSHYEYPYRGAEILERELNSGRVEATPENFSLLANMWRQAREWDRAMPVLRRVATLTGEGPDFEKLGEALYQAHDYQEAEAMFVQALRRGGLNRPGDTWALIGVTRVELDEFRSARRAFREALAWEYSRAGAQGWLSYVNQVIDREDPTGRIEMEGCGFDIERRRRRPATADEIDSTGRRIFDLTPACLIYFDAYGDLRPEFERS
jgi:tetratricopeptide (TPR) repeat protein